MSEFKPLNPSGVDHEDLAKESEINDDEVVLDIVNQLLAKADFVGVKDLIEQIQTQKIIPGLKSALSMLEEKYAPNARLAKMVRRKIVEIENLEATAAKTAKLQAETQNKKDDRIKKFQEKIDTLNGSVETLEGILSGKKPFFFKTVKILYKDFSHMDDEKWDTYSKHRAYEAEETSYEYDPVNSKIVKLNQRFNPCCGSPSETKVFAEPNPDTLSSPYGIPTLFESLPEDAETLEKDKLETLLNSVKNNLDFVMEYRVKTQKELHDARSS